MYDAKLLRREADRAEFEIQCSSGTYVRTLFETLGDAYCERLRRTASVRFESRTHGEPLAVEERSIPARAGPGRGRGGRVAHGGSVRPPRRPGDR